MQLWQLGLLVIGGISLVVFLVHATGGSRKAVLADAQAAIKRFAEDYPDMKPLDVQLTMKRDAAFLALPDHSIGLVQAVGNCFLTRLVSAPDLAKVTFQGTTLSLGISDFTFKGGTYEFASANELRSVQELLANIGAHHA